jgi:hypothetical protein
MSNSIEHPIKLHLYDAYNLQKAQQELHMNYACVHFSLGPHWLSHSMGLFHFLATTLWPVHCLTGSLPTAAHTPVLTINLPKQLRSEIPDNWNSSC